MEIDSTRPAPLDQLALDHIYLRTPNPSIDFCRRVAGIEAPDEVIARRLSIAVSTVRGWRKIGQRAS